MSKSGSEEFKGIPEVRSLEVRELSEGAQNRMMKQGLSLVKEFSFTALPIL